MKHLHPLDKFKDYNFIYYETCTDKLVYQYERMYGIIKASGHALMSDAWSLDSGILLEKDDEVIAGTFFNLSKSSSSILIHVIFVEEPYRQQGIYTRMHELLNDIGNHLGRKNIYSYIHIQNKLMNDHIMKKIGYEPIMQLVKREIK
jgi:RimJ/RimL family protein N-acetyltransferase